MRRAKVATLAMLVLSSVHCLSMYASPKSIFVDSLSPTTTKNVIRNNECERTFSSRAFGNPYPSGRSKALGPLRAVSSGGEAASEGASIPNEVFNLVKVSSCVIYI